MAFTMNSKVPRTPSAAAMEILEVELERVYRGLNTLLDSLNTLTETVDALDSSSSGSGDVVGPAASVDSEVALFSGVTGKLLKRATGSGRPKLTSGVLSLAAIDLATADVTGRLPLANLVQGGARSVLGVAGNATADYADITAATDGHVLRRSGTSIGFGQIVAAGITDATVTPAKLADLSALSVLGRSANTAGVMAAIAAANDAEVLRRSGASIGFGTVATAGLTDAAVTLAKMADLAQARVIGRADAAGTGVPQALTGAQLLTIIGSLAGATGAFYQGTTHPQGNQAAPVGSVYANTSTGIIFNKAAGGSTAYGWYPQLDLRVSGPRYFSINAVDGNASVIVSVGAVSAISAPAAAAVGSDPSASWFSYQSDGYYCWPNVTTTLANTVSINTNSTTRFMFQPDQDFDISFAIRTAPAAWSAALTNMILTVGVRKTSITNSDDTTDNAVLFRYAPVAGDTGWVGYTHDGTTGSVSAVIGGAIAADTAYRLRMRKVGADVFFSVNDGTEVQKSNNLPTVQGFGHTMFLSVSILNRAGGAGTARGFGFCSAVGFRG